jgi:hypothetical protein
MEITTPIAAPAKTTRGKDFDPTSSSWRINSRHWYGGVTAALITRQEKMPRLPNHSKTPSTKPVMVPVTEGKGALHRVGLGRLTFATAVYS